MGLVVTGACCDSGPVAETSRLIEVMIIKLDRKIRIRRWANSMATTLDNFVN